MKQYFYNLGKFLSGLTKLGSISYKPGWGPWKFFPLYVVDYGTHVLTGAAVVSWSRWFHDNRDKSRIAKFFDRFLNYVEEDHGAKAGPALWGTTDCAPPIRALSSTSLIASPLYLWGYTMLCTVIFIVGVGVAVYLWRRGADD
jgi:hypothetical protein